MEEKNKMNIKKIITCVVLSALGIFLFFKVRKMYYKKMAQILTDFKMMKVLIIDHMSTVAFYTGLMLAMTGGYDINKDKYMENCLTVGFNFVNRVENKIRSGFKNKFEIVRTYYKIKKYEKVYLKFMMSIPAHCMDDEFPSTFNAFEKDFEKLTI